MFFLIGLSKLHSSELRVELIYVGDDNVLESLFNLILTILPTFEEDLLYFYKLGS